jgi:hypothetical protein
VPSVPFPGAGTEGGMRVFGAHSSIASGRPREIIATANGCWVRVRRWSPANALQAERPHRHLRLYGEIPPHPRAT